MQWGTVAEWVTIIGGILSFIIVNAVAWAMVRRDVRENKARIGSLTGEVAVLRAEQIAVKTLAHCIDRADDIDEEIKGLRSAMVTVPMFDDRQGKCRSQIDLILGANSRETEAMRLDLREIKNMVSEQGTNIGAMAVAMGQLSTKIDERTSSRLDRGVAGVNA